MNQEDEYKKTGSQIGSTIAGAGTAEQVRQHAVQQFVPDTYTGHRKVYDDPNAKLPPKRLSLQRER
ncbi:hypothetical protein [uncultured Megasphaera sp.]|uniref:hypothetical protein n=1 Tax=uncultured Megasphaera sp. TaxID=165188 RepID=UPI0025E59A70|nr:hypothetical protein [uncultured Megasphaera sp.]